MNDLQKGILTLLCTALMTTGVIFFIIWNYNVVSEEYEDYDKELYVLRNHPIDNASNLKKVITLCDKEYKVTSDNMEERIDIFKEVCIVTKDVYFAYNWTLDYKRTFPLLKLQHEIEPDSGLSDSTRWSTVLSLSLFIGAIIIGLSTMATFFYFKDYWILSHGTKDEKRKLVWEQWKSNNSHLKKSKADTITFEVALYNHHKDLTKKDKNKPWTEDALAFAKLSNYEWNRTKFVKAYPKHKKMMQMKFGEEY